MLYYFSKSLEFLWKFLFCRFFNRHLLVSICSCFHFFGIFSTSSILQVLNSKSFGLKNHKSLLKHNFLTFIYLKFRQVKVTKNWCLFTFSGPIQSLFTLALTSRTVALPVFVIRWTCLPAHRPACLLRCCCYQGCQVNKNGQSRPQICTVFRNRLFLGTKCRIWLI